MEVRFTPDLEEKLNELAASTGRATDDLVREVMAGYLHDLARLRSTLDGRYDDLKSGRLDPIDGEEAFVRLQEKSRARRARNDA